MSDIGLDIIEQAPGRTQLRAEFFIKAIPRTVFETDAATNERKERLVYENREYVKVTFPEGREKPEFRVTERHIAMFPKQYARFKAGQEQIVDGTPVEMLPYLTKADVANLKAASVMSEEQLSALSDASIAAIGLNGRELRAKAQARLKAADSSAGLMAQASKVTELQEQLAAQASEMAEMRRLLAAKESKK